MTLLTMLFGISVSAFLLREIIRDGIRYYMSQKLIQINRLSKGDFSGE